MNISICQNQNILSLPEVEVKYDMSQLLTCPAALLISIAQLSEAVDNSPDQPASPQIRQIQLQMRDSVWEALKDFTVHLNQVNRISEFLSKTLQTTGLRLQIQLKRMEVFYVTKCRTKREFCQTNLISYVESNIFKFETPKKLTNQVKQFH